MSKARKHWFTATSKGASEKGAFAWAVYGSCKSFPKGFKPIGIPKGHIFNYRLHIECTPQQMRAVLKRAKARFIGQRMAGIKECMKRMEILAQEIVDVGNEVSKRERKLAALITKEKAKLPCKTNRTKK